jgi:hypothetical protein
LANAEHWNGIYSLSQFALDASFFRFTPACQERKLAVRPLSH